MAMRITAVCTALLLISGAGHSGSTNWLGGLHLGPKSAVVFPGIGVSWPSAEWSFQWWLESAPRVGRFVLDAGVFGFVCGPRVCTATVYGDQGGTIILESPRLHPYSVYAFQVSAEELPGGLHAELRMSGGLVASGDLPGEIFAPAADLVLTQRPGSVHSFTLPLRLWATASPEPWLFGDPAPTDAALVGLWRVVEGGVVVDATGRHHGAVVGPGGATRPLCWEWGSDLVGFRDGFESGDWSRWSVAR